MSSNKNLFYKLYSTNNNVVLSGYTCNSAIDEADTSFDITTDINGKSNGTITDSNGNTLSTIDLSSIHASGISQYTTETRIIQPHSCCVIQGQEYGLACASYYYVIPKQVKDAEQYEYYLDCDFDVVYNNFAPKKFHIHTVADGHTSFTKQINDLFKKYNIEVAVSLQEEKDEIDGHLYTYLVFLSQKEGYFYYINNLRITLEFQSENFPDSPFVKGISEIKTYIYDLIEEFHPMPVETIIDSSTDDISRINTDYDPNTYEVDCELYSWLLHNYNEAVNDIDDFGKMINYLQLAFDTEDPDEAAIYIDKANIAIQGTVYDVDGLFDKYIGDSNVDQLIVIYNIIEQIKNKIDELNEYYKSFYWLKEDVHKRIPLMKYPNGAFRGIVLIPDWPNKTDDYEYASLWVNHIKSKVKLYMPTKEHQFLPKIYGVLANATLIKEEHQYRDQHPEFGDVAVDGAINTLSAGWDEGFRRETLEQQMVKDIDTDYVDPYRPNKDVNDDLTWMGQKYYSKKKDIIGLFRYIQYVQENNLWNKVGDAYMIIGKDDDPQSHNLNLPTSLLVYNPNPDPIRIKYMIFS